MNTREFSNLNNGNYFIFSPYIGNVQYLHVIYNGKLKIYFFKLSQTERYYITEDNTSNTETINSISEKFKIQHLSISNVRIFTTNKSYIIDQYKRIFINSRITSRPYKRIEKCNYISKFDEYKFFRFNMSYEQSCVRHLTIKEKIKIALT